MISADLQERLIEKEMRVQSAHHAGDLAAIDALLAEDFREIGSGGRCYRKSDVLDAMRGVQVIDYAGEQFEAIPVDQNCVILTYVSTVKRVIEGRECLTHAFRSSTWVRRNDAWTILFHQATPLPTSAGAIPA